MTLDLPCDRGITKVKDIMGTLWETHLQRNHQHTRRIYVVPKILSHHNSPQRDLLLSNLWFWHLELIDTLGKSNSHCLVWVARRINCCGELHSPCVALVPSPVGSSFKDLCTALQCFIANSLVVARDHTKSPTSSPELATRENSNPSCWQFDSTSSIYATWGLCAVFLCLWSCLRQWRLSLEKSVLLWKTGRKLCYVSLRLKLTLSSLGHD